MITFIDASFAVMAIHQKVSCEGLLGEGIEIILKHLYLNDYAEFDSKIMFLHDYLLTCEISTVRTLALRV